MLLSFGRPVHNMDYLFCLTNAAKQLAGLRSKSALPYEKLRISGRDIKHCCWLNHSAFMTEQNPKLGLANVYGLFQHRVEHWLQFAGRSRNTSLVAACCSNASLSSRQSRATSVSWPAGEELCGRAAFKVFALRLRTLAGLLLALERRRIAFHPRPKLRDSGLE
jgi:hypothetical protein